MNYYGLPCPVCGEIMKSDDDIVVCPECATPHHRECWFKNGRCINQELHGEDFVWSAKKTKAEPEETAEASQSENPQNDNIAPDSILCHICSSENPADALHCGNCGALFGEPETEESTKNCPFCGTANPANAMRCGNCGNFFAQDIENDFFKSAGIDESEKIGNYSAGDYALFTQLNAKKYVPKFRKIEEGKTTFNWAAFFFGAQWFLFRKMYKTGIILLIVFASITMMCTPVANKLMNAYDKFSLSVSALPDEGSADAQTEAELAVLAEKSLEEFTKEAGPSSFFLLSVWLLENFACALIADKMYYKKIKADLKLIDETVADDGVRKIMIARRGGVSFLAFIAGSLGQDALLSLFVLSAEKLSSLF